MFWSQNPKATGTANRKNDSQNGPTLGTGSAAFGTADLAYLFDNRSEAIQLINSSISLRGFLCPPAHFGKAGRVAAQLPDRRRHSNRIVGVSRDAAT